MFKKKKNQNPFLFLFIFLIISNQFITSAFGQETTSSSGVAENEECDDDLGCGKDASRLLLSFVIVVFIGIIVVFIVVRVNFHYIPESLAVVFYGVIIGLIIRFSNLSLFDHLATYNANKFFLFILPFIIFETGYTLTKYEFFKNIRVIIILATVGCFISFIGTGLGIHLLGKTSASAPLTMLDSLIVGAVTCATDPVATLAIFKALDVEPTLYMIVLGESILNDAVGVILYEAVIGYTIKEVWKPILLFITMFIGSIVLGIVIALVLAILLKYIDFGKFPALETIFILIFSYLSYLIADSIYLSGILSSFFCGITTSQYVYKSLSSDTKKSVSQLFKLISFVGETIVFIYIGITLPNHNFNFDIRLFIWTFILLIVTRAISVFPAFFLFSNKVSKPIQVVIWLSGLRGAISFSLMSQSEINEANNPSLVKTDILLSVISTLFIFGFATYPLLKLLKIQLNQSDQTLESITRNENYQQPKFHFISSLFRKTDLKLTNFFSRDTPPEKKNSIKQSQQPQTSSKPKSKLKPQPSYESISKLMKKDKRNKGDIEMNEFNTDTENDNNAIVNNNNNNNNNKNKTNNDNCDSSKELLFEMDDLDDPLTENYIAKSSPQFIVQLIYYQPDNVNPELTKVDKDDSSGNSSLLSCVGYYFLILCFLLKIIDNNKTTSKINNNNNNILIYIYI
ncbi:hypothetical protein DICPUDRAFT_84741 [Dictyostelium purpureum]|uniref:Sodium/hydrogen exchanger n=1 Tax=Dictyostelium purpureum TaxID=5786 RepID=F1A3L1_DICPU|nr:uncharacterized protein DICPUDRAFT_84741 [Dictyostelium purpureum]EGC29218.1 hypothetical protein DICPUDRAFT_84741 [Dictyostelium purpureum]|eukprot:XP_003294254.1 hypothetical protein DICPUDRAFT_84741 [Dictyostelium purpureum]